MEKKLAVKSESSPSKGWRQNTQATESSSSMSSWPDKKKEERHCWSSQSRVKHVGPWEPSRVGKGTFILCPTFYTPSSKGRTLGLGSVALASRIRCIKGQAENECPFPTPGSSRAYMFDPVWPTNNAFLPFLIWPWDMPYGWWTRPDLTASFFFHKYLQVPLAQRLGLLLIKFETTGSDFNPGSNYIEKFKTQSLKYWYHW